MPLGRQTSLLDDPRFLAELEQIDIPTRPGSRRSVVPLDEASATAPQVPDLAWWPRQPKFICEPASAPGGWSTGGMVLAFVGFLLMMCVGGAAATLIFHSRVARILARQPIS